MAAGGVRIRCVLTLLQLLLACGAARRPFFTSQTLHLAGAGDPQERGFFTVAAGSRHRGPGTALPPDRDHIRSNLRGQNHRHRWRRSIDGKEQLQVFGQ
eukprot:g28103.t1